MGCGGEVEGDRETIHLAALRLDTGRGRAVSWNAKLYYTVQSLRGMMCKKLICMILSHAWWNMKGFYDEHVWRV